MELVTLARLVWEIDKIDIPAFVRFGSLAASKPQRLDPELQAAVDRRMDEILTTGRLVIESPGN